MIKTALVVFLILAFGQCSWSAPSRVSHLQNMARVEVKKENQVVLYKARKILLGDLAIFDQVPKQVQESLSTIEVSAANGESGVIEMSGYEVSRMARTKISEVQRRITQRIVFKVPPKVSIHYRRQYFDESSLEREIIDRLNKNCDHCEYEIIQLSMPAVSDEVIGQPWKIQFSEKPIKGSFSLPVVFGRAKSGQKMFWISGRVLQREEVPVATRRLSAGERIKEGDFKMTLRDTTLAIDGVAKISDLVGKKLKRGVAFDHIIWQNSIERKLALRFGDKVKVLVGEPGWQVSMTAVARGNGDVGDIVKLINPKTKKIISGEIIAERTVRLR